MKFPQLRCQLTIFCSLLLWTISSITRYTYNYFLSEEVQLGSFSLGLSQQASKLNTLNLISLGVLFGLSVENFDFGFQYNIPLRQINTVFAPSIFEFNISFDFSVYRRNNRGGYKRLSIDNY